LKGVVGLHHTDVELEAMGLLVLVGEKEEIFEQGFEADDRDWFARFLSRWAKDLLKMAAVREAGVPLFGGDPNLEAGKAARTYGPLRAQIFIPDERGVQAEWRFETTDVAELADWLVALGKVPAPDHDGRASGPRRTGLRPEPEIFVLIREERSARASSRATSHRAGGAAAEAKAAREDGRKAGVVTSFPPIRSDPR
jgi:hypothetical protein